MTRTTTLIATGLTTLALSACGTAATTSSSSSPVKPAAPAVTQPAQTPAQAHAGYFDMTVLQFADRARLNARLADRSDKAHFAPGLKVTDVTCIPSGALSATCNVTFSDGFNTTSDVTIAADGQTYVAR